MENPEPTVPPRRAASPTPARRQPLPPLTTRVKLVAGTVLGLTAAAFVVDVRRERTGTLTAQSGAVDVRVTLSRGGRLVAGPTDRRTFTLPPGDYEVGLTGDTAGLRAVPSRATVVRGRRALVRVERAPAPKGEGR